MPHLMPLLIEKGKLAVSDLTELGESRHKARHDLEDLLAKGLVLKQKEGRTVTYVRVMNADDAVAVMDADDAVTVVDHVMTVPAEVAPVVNALRPRKALSIPIIARRCGLPVADVRTALTQAVMLGLAVRPFNHSLRFRRS